MNMLNSKPTDFTKEYLPGYTGHVPSKNDMFGKTAGEINRDIVVAKGISPVVYQQTYKPDADRLYKDFKPNDNDDVRKDIYGNYSRYATNWISGPCHAVRKQYIPGYTGHVKGMISENIFSKSYARCTATAIGKKHPIGHDVLSRTRFHSQQRQEFTPQNFRRFVEKPNIEPKRDYDDYTKYINETYADKKDNVLAKTVTASSGGFGHKIDNNTLQTLNCLRTHTHQRRFGKHIKGSRSIAGITEVNQTRRNINDIKPKILESNVASKQDFFQLSDGFKRVFADDRKDERMVVPIVGYGGHRRGDRSQNYFGKSFRETTIQSKKLERAMMPADRKE